MTQSIIDDLVKSDLPFSVHFDETTTSQVKKQFRYNAKVLVTKT